MRVSPASTISMRPPAASASRIGRNAAAGLSGAVAFAAAASRPASVCRQVQNKASASPRAEGTDARPAGSELPQRLSPELLFVRITTPPAARWRGALAHADIMTIPPPSW